MMVELFAAETAENNNRGRPMPMPKKRKLPKLVIKLVVDVLIAKRTISDAGLQGSTIAPKKNPKPNAVLSGFLPTGVRNFGKNLLISILKINTKLIRARMPKAMGEIMPIALVNDACKSCVKISPMTNMDATTPKVTITPSKRIVFFFDFVDSCDAKYAKKAG